MNWLLWLSIGFFRFECRFCDHWCWGFNHVWIKRAVWFLDEERDWTNRRETKLNQIRSSGTESWRKKKKLWGLWLKSSALKDWNSSNEETIGIGYTPIKYFIYIYLYIFLYFFFPFLCYYFFICFFFRRKNSFLDLFSRCEEESTTSSSKTYINFSSLSLSPSLPLPLSASLTR